MLIYGKNVAVEKLKTQDKINKIYLSDKFKDKEILDLIEKRNSPISRAIILRHHGYFGKRTQICKCNYNSPSSANEQ